jgi:CRP/FNR family cyclic AMP-dependent transcriptional regulator
MSEIKNFLQQVDLFSGLSDKSLAKIAELCRVKNYRAGDVVVERNTPPDSFYLIETGTVQIVTAPEDRTESFSNAAIILLGRGQSFGEMGLVDKGPRSATAKAVTDTKLLALDCQPFRALCDADTNLGYQVMKNIAVDLSFKLRYRNLI